MSDQPDTNSLETDVAPSHSAILVGATLKTAREEHDMTVADICTNLRISPHQVKALESDDFSALPEAMITRGFIRNYARLLGIDAEPLLEAYRASMPSATPRTLTLKSENILITGKDKRSWLKYIVASLLIAFSLGAWQFYMDYVPKPSAKRAERPVQNANTHTDTASSPEVSAGVEPVTSKTVTEQLPDIALPAAERVPDEAAPAATVTSDATSIASSATANASPSKTATTAVAASNASQPLSANTATTAKLKLSFTQTSWVNVLDRNKKMIFDKIMSAGSEDMVEGLPPFEVVVGNAPGSKLIFNDKPVDLAPYTKSNVARITLE
jgi:cytoskeleton protein RodZ